MVLSFQTKWYWSDKKLMTEFRESKETNLIVYIFISLSTFRSSIFSHLNVVINSRKLQSRI
jgi:hypothetical protein